VIHALAAGTAVFRATAGDANGTSGTWTLPTQVATLGTANYAGNAEFGEPTDADPSDDFILRHLEYTASYNKTLGDPNWVSYDIDASHFGPLDRCNCFTFDPALPQDFTHYTTADYTGAGTVAGFGIDRGHLARSFDRTSGSLDNAFTFYFSNIVPQASDLNQGPWANLEQYLGDKARFENREVYVIAGGAGIQGTIKNEGKIVIPVYMWKVALILPRDHGLADVHSYSDVEVVAVVMPNAPGIRNANWESFKTTVDSVEALSGYDLLARLPDPIEIAVESNTKPPIAAVDGPYQSLPHLSIGMSGAGSSDPDGDALTYAWSFGDGGGSESTGATVTHAYQLPGTYTVRLIVTDPRTLADTTFTTAVVQTPAQALLDAHGLVDRLVESQALDLADAKWIDNKLDIAAKLAGQAEVMAVVNQLQEVVRRLTKAGPDTAPLIDAMDQLIQSLTS
jgi:DNA/RNA endonuclease G (NUC1)